MANALAAPTTTPIAMRAWTIMDAARERREPVEPCQRGFPMAALHQNILAWRRSSDHDDDLQTFMQLATRIIEWKQVTLPMHHEIPGRCRLVSIMLVADLGVDTRA